jgi:hypothetical protein
MCALGACSTVQDVPMPWDAKEPRDAETPMTAPASLAGTDWTRIGSSIRGKPIEAATFGTGTRRIYVIAGIAGDETEGPRLAPQLPDELLAISGLSDVTIRIVRNMNPDGAGAKTRANIRGVDLSRNWPSKDFHADATSGSRAASELETNAVFADMTKFKPDLVIALRSSSRGASEVRFEGPGLLSGQAFVRGARQQDPKWRLVPPSETSLPGSIESLVGRDWKKPILSVEYYRGRELEVSTKATRDGLLAIASLPEIVPAAAKTTQAKQAAAKGKAMPSSKAKGPAIASEENR